jgi:DNA-binding protein Fis
MMDHSAEYPATKPASGAAALADKKNCLEAHAMIKKYGRVKASIKSGIPETTLYDRYTRSIRKYGMSAIVRRDDRKDCITAYHLMAKYGRIKAAVKSGIPGTTLYGRAQKAIWAYGMPDLKRDDEKYLQMIVNICGKMSRANAAKVLGIHRSTLRDNYARAIRQGITTKYFTP